MIEPLRYHKETATTMEIERPVYCACCVSQRATKDNPNLGVVYCSDCPASFVSGGKSTTPGVREKGAFLCKVCEADRHKHGITKDHRRQIVVVGPGLRKKVLVRGDGVSFPLPLDLVTVKMRARIYHQGRRVHRERTREIPFIVGMSGKCVHVQILGARNLRVGDANGSSDPFVVYSFCGKPLHSTRVRHHTLNPRWDNETIVVPMDENLPLPRDCMLSQRDLFKLEVFDKDFFSANEFLGHVEMHRTKLMKLAVVAQEQPIRIPLTSREIGGLLHVQLGLSEDAVVVKIICAEDLDKRDIARLNNAYVKVYLGDVDNTLVGITPIVKNAINPTWTANNVFSVPVDDFLAAEAYLAGQIRIYRASTGMAATAASPASPQSRDMRQRRQNLLLDTAGFEDFNTLPDFLGLIRLEVHDNGSNVPILGRAQELLGRCAIHIETVRRELPELPPPVYEGLDAFFDAQDTQAHTHNGLQSLMQRSLSQKRGGLQGHAALTLQRAVSTSFRHMFSSRPRTRTTISRSSLQKDDDESSAIGFEGADDEEEEDEDVEDEENNSLAQNQAPQDHQAAVAAEDDLEAQRHLAEPTAMGGSRRSSKASDVSRATSHRSQNRSQSGSVNGSAKRRPPDVPPETSPEDPSDASSRQSHSQESQSSRSQSSQSLSRSSSLRSSNRPASASGPPRPPHAPPLEPPPDSGATHANTNDNNGVQNLRRSFFSAFPRPASIFVPPQSPSSNASIISAPQSPPQRTPSSPSRLALPHTPLSPFTNTLSRLLSTRLQPKTPKKATEEIMYSSVLRLQLTRGTRLNLVDTPDYVNDTQPEDFGYLVVRLLISTRGTVLQGLDQAVQRMTLGESAQVKCRFDYAYGSYCLHSHIPPRASVIFTVQVVSLNGQGRDVLSVLRRNVTRMMRLVQSLSKLSVGALCVLMWVSLVGLVSLLSETSEERRLREKRARRRRGKDSDDEEDEDDEEEGEDSDSDSNADSNADEHKDHDDAEDEDAFPGAQEEVLDQRMSATQRAKDRPKTIKPDVHAKQHLNTSVRAGGSLLLGYKMRDYKPPRPGNNRSSGNAAGAAYVGSTGSDRGSSKKPMLRSETSKLRALQEMMQADEGAVEEDDEDYEDEEGY